MGKLIYGVGVSEDGEFKRSIIIDSKCRNTREYTLWSNMLARCYSSKFQEKNPTYIGCTVSENFKNFQYFAKWCQNQVGFGNIKFQLDKDVLCKANRTYCEELCVFVPVELNSAVIKRDKSRGVFPIGVYYDKYYGVYRTHLRFGGKSFVNKNGSHETPETAFQAYKVAKEQFIKEQAELWKDKIDIRVYEALMKYEVNIDD